MDRTASTGPESHLPDLGSRLWQGLVKYWKGNQLFQVDVLDLAGTSNKDPEPKNDQTNKDVMASDQAEPPLKSGNRLPPGSEAAQRGQES